MNLQIREMTSNDKLEVLSMMKEFYSSDAVYSSYYIYWCLRNKLRCAGFNLC